MAVTLNVAVLPARFVRLCGCDVIAKRCLSDRAAIEWMVYREVLPHLPVSALHGYGSVALQAVPKQR